MKLNRYLQFLCVLSFLAFVIRVCLDSAISDVTLNISNNKDLHHGYWNGTEEFIFHHPQEVISMEEYLRFYQLDALLHHSCSYIRRPDPEEISWKKGVYQYVRMKFEDPEGLAFVDKQ